jgi:hypothetical protein
MDFHGRHYDIFRRKEGKKVSFPRAVISFPKGPARYFAYRLTSRPFSIVFFTNEILISVTDNLRAKEKLSQAKCGSYIL